MATATAYTATNMNVSGLFGASNITLANSTHIQEAEVGTGRVMDYYGTFVIGATTATGTVTSLTLTTNGTLNYTVSGSFNLTTLNNYVTNGDWAGLQNYIFAGNDVVTGSAGSDVLGGYGGDDNIGGNAGNDTLIGGAGNDFLAGGAGNDILNGGTQTQSWGDTAAYYDATAGVTVNLGLTSAQNTVGAGTDTLIGIESVSGSNFNDKLTGNTQDNTLDGGAGNDVLTGGAGDDWMTGGAGNDTLNGGTNTWGDTASYSWAATAGVTVDLNLTTAQNTIGAGTDTLIGIEGLDGTAFNDKLTGNGADNYLRGNAGNDVLAGGAGNDWMIGGAGNDTLNGGTGTLDYAAYEDATAGVTVSLGLTTAQNTIGAGTDTLTGIECISGSGFNDKLTGNGGNNFLEGLAGNDTLNAGAGNDLVFGGAGNDVLAGGTGADTAAYVDAAKGVTVNLSLTSAQATGGSGTDTLSGFEGVMGSLFGDTLRGNSVNNGLAYTANQLVGLDGADTIIGGAGAESIIGDAGGNFPGVPFSSFTAGTWTGKDTLTGGGGADRFMFANVFDSTVGTGRDVITDFVRGTDKVDLSAMDAQTAAGTANDAFAFIAGTSFTAAGQVRFANGILYGNTDADASAEFEIALTGITTLAATDLVL